MVVKEVNQDQYQTEKSLMKIGKRYLAKRRKMTNEIEPIKQKLDDKIKALNSSRVYKKITPKGDLSWYVKWIASFFILTAVMCRSVEEVPRIFDVVFSIIGTIGWAWVGYLWHDRALLLLNGTIVVFLGMSLIRYFFV